MSRFLRRALRGLRFARRRKTEPQRCQVATGSDMQILPPDEVVIWSLVFSPHGYIDFVRSQKTNMYDTFSLPDNRAGRSSASGDAERDR